MNWLVPTVDTVGTYGTILVVSIVVSTGTSTCWYLALLGCRCVGVQGNTTYVRRGSSSRAEQRSNILELEFWLLWPIRTLSPPSLTSLAKALIATVQQLSSTFILSACCLSRLCYHVVFLSIQIHHHRRHRCVDQGMVVEPWWKETAASRFCRMNRMNPCSIEILLSSSVLQI
jgi:hypothetical protein